MTPPHDDPAHLTRIAAVLIGLTLAVGGIAESGGLASPRLVATVALLAACGKAWLVLGHFMALRHAPPVWRWLFQGWALLCTAGILLALWWVPQVPS